MELPQGLVVEFQALSFPLSPASELDLSWKTDAVESGHQPRRLEEIDEAVDFLLEVVEAGEGGDVDGEDEDAVAATGRLGVAAAAGSAQGP